MLKETVVALSVATLASSAAVLPTATAQAADTRIQLAACNPCPCKASACNPCNPCNPCKAAAACNPCNPCAAAACNPCNPCKAAAACNPCNPCAACS